MNEFRWINGSCTACGSTDQPRHLVGCPHYGAAGVEAFSWYAMGRDDMTAPYNRPSAPGGWDRWTRPDGWSEYGW